MRRLVVGMLLLAALSQLPVVADNFREEREGVQAVYGKAANACRVATDVYGQASSALSDEHAPATAQAVKKKTAGSRANANPTGVSANADDQIGEQVAEVVSVMGSLVAKVKDTIAQDDVAQAGQSPGAGVAKAPVRK